jgi:hypothetical protein
VGNDFDLQNERIARVRNSAQHGGPILDESVESIADLADRLRQQIMADMVGGLLKGRACASTLAGIQELGPRRRRELKRTGSPLAALSVAVEFV